METLTRFFVRMPILMLRFVVWLQKHKFASIAVVVVFIVIVIMGKAATTKKINHGESAKEFNGHYYNVWHIEGKVVTWKRADELARSDGGYLLQIDDIVDADGHNIEAQWVYREFCDADEYYFMGSSSKFYSNSDQIIWNEPVSEDEYLEWWIVEYDK